jgi:hypothetical protein
MSCSLLIFRRDFGYETDIREIPNNPLIRDPAYIYDPVTI